MRALPKRALVSCFAPTFHHALGYLDPFVVQLGFRTDLQRSWDRWPIPRSSQRSLIGVAQLSLLGIMARGTSERAVSNTPSSCTPTTDSTSFRSARRLPCTSSPPTGASVERLERDAEAAWAPPRRAASIRGGDIERNVDASSTRSLTATPGAVFDVVCANAGWRSWSRVAPRICSRDSIRRAPVSRSGAPPRAARTARRGLE